MSPESTESKNLAYTHSSSDLHVSTYGHTYSLFHTRWTKAPQIQLAHGAQRLSTEATHDGVPVSERYCQEVADQARAIDLVSVSW